MIQAYNYLLESLPVKRDARYPVSKRNELRKVYNNIVNLSTASPFYKINLSKENQEYTIGVKETALALKAKINDMEDPKVSGFRSKTVTVSDEKVLSAQLLNENTQELPDRILMKVNSLAAVQVNKGKELMHSSRSLPSGEYDFNAKIGDETYHLTFTLEERTENEVTLKKMADFLNENVPGISALVEKGSVKDYSRLTILSDMSGRFGDKKFIFNDNDIFREGIVDFFGMNRMESAPSYAKFDLNDSEKQTATNTFTLANALRITLHSSSDQPVTIKIVPDSDKILTAVDSVLDTFNNFIGLAENHTQDSKEHYRAAKLISDLKSLESLYGDELAASGIKVSDNGSLSVDEALAVQAAQDGGMESLFTRENGFITRLLDKAEAIAINPMEYLDKIVVTYPDSNKNVFRNPYVTSMYSGLFFNSYC